LQLKRDISDFIQKQRTLVSQLKPADLLSDRTGEGAALMAKKFAFEQTGGNGSAAELHKVPVFPAAALVYRAGDEFLAGARFSQQEYGRIGSRHHFDQLQDLPEGWTLPNDPREVGPWTDFFRSIEFHVPADRAQSNTRKLSVAYVKIRNISQIHGDSPQQ
jgi:hypothetical protein